MSLFAQSADGKTLIVQVHSCGGSGWRHLTIIERCDLSILLPQHHKSTATNVTCRRENNRQGKLGSNGSIYSVTALA